MLQGKCLENVNRFVKIAVFTSLSKKIYVSHQVEIVDFTILERRKFRERIYCIFIENSSSNCRRSRRRDLVKSGPQRPRKQRSARACPVARACYVCATLGRSTTPTSFLLEHAPMFSPCIRIRARVTYDLLLFEEERKQLHRSSFILHREIGSMMITLQSLFLRNLFYSRSRYITIPFESLIGIKILK